MATINDPTTGGNAMAVDAFGAGTVKIADNAGNPVSVVSDAAPTTVAGVVMMGMNDRSLLPVRVDRLGNLASALHNQLLSDSFEGTTINPDRYTITNTTMLATQATNSGVLFNSGAITTITTGYMMQSAKRFAKVQRSPLAFRARARLNFVTNSIMELGFADAATFNGTNTVGAYFQVTSAGVLQPVMTFNSVDTTGTSITFSASNYYVFDIVCDDDWATFTVQDTSTGLIINKQIMKVPLTAARMFSATSLTTQVRLYNTGSAPALAPSLILTDLYVYDLDIAKNRAWPHALAAQGKGMMALPSTGAQLCQWTNSTEPSSATLSNTAAGYSTYGGKFQFAALGGVTTDYALFAVQIPTTANFVVTGITIDTWNTGAASATTSTLLEWAIGAGGLGVSLATATINRMGIGAQSMPTGTAIGGALAQIVKNFTTPIHVAGGRFLHIILRMPVGTATGSQVIAGHVNVEGFWE